MDAVFLAKAATRQAEKKKAPAGSSSATPSANPRPSGTLVIWDPRVAQMVPTVSTVPDREKRKAKVDAVASSPKKARTESSLEIWHPKWDIREGDSFFQPNEGGRFINMSAFDAFVLPRDREMLEKVDVEKSLGAATCHISRVKFVKAYNFFTCLTFQSY